MAQGTAVRVAGIQSDICWEDPAATFERLIPWLEAARAAGARLAVLPEMYACGFTMDSAKVAEPEDGPSATFLREQAARLGMWICGSVPERPEGAALPYNTLIVAGPGGEAHRYRKIHPFTYAGEHESYLPGSDFLSVEIEGLRVSFFICYDLRFADELWAVAEGTDAYVVVANWPEARRRHWTTLLTARAIENQAYVVGVNRVGDGGKLHYTGDSRIVDPLGETLASAAGGETLLLADLDPGHVADVRRRLPFLPDRR